MAGTSRELAITHLAQHAAQRLLGDDDAEFLENPLAEIDDPPAHDPVNRRNWAERGERGAMRVVQPRRLPSALRSIRPSGPCALNLTTQSRTTCSPTPPIFAASVRLGLVVIGAKARSARASRPVFDRFARAPHT